MRSHGKTHTTSCRLTPVAASRPPSLSLSTPLLPQRRGVSFFLVTWRWDDRAPGMFTDEEEVIIRRQVGLGNEIGAENRMHKKKRAAPRWLVVSDARVFGGADAALRCPADLPSGLPSPFPHWAMLAVCLNPFAWPAVRGNDDQDEVRQFNVSSDRVKGQGLIETHGAEQAGLSSPPPCTQGSSGDACESLLDHRDQLFNHDPLKEATGI